MPLTLEKQINDAKKLAVWDINEPTGYFVDKLQLKQDENRSEKRLCEQAAGMLLLNQLCGEGLHKQLDKDVYGKPFIHNSLISVSFSHSKNLVACLVDFSGGPAGIDIELCRHNIGLLASKFASIHDTTPLNGDAHHQLIWGAKEVLYKIYGKKELDFKRDMKIAYNDALSGSLCIPGYSKQFQLDYMEIGTFLMVWNV